MYKMFCLYLVLALASFPTFSQLTKTHNLFKDKSKFKIFQNRVESIFSKNYKPSTLSKSDYTIMEDLLIPVIDSFNINGEKSMRELARPYIKMDRNAFIIDTSRLKFQIIAVINNKGEKLIWLNAFCNEHNLTWRKNIVLVKDGGICFFHLTINLTKNKIISFIVNGEA